ncbi:unnamed protein product [Sphagnum balticum]
MVVAIPQALRLTPVSREYSSLIRLDQHTDATGVSQLLEKLFQSRAIMSMQLVLAYHRAALLQAPPPKKNRLWSWRALDGIGQTGLFWSCYSSCGLKKDREFPILAIQVLFEIFILH